MTYVIYHNIIYTLLKSNITKTYCIIAVTESEIYKKMVEMENLADTRLKAISVLETQKFDLVQG